MRRATGDYRLTTAHGNGSQVMQTEREKARAEFRAEALAAWQEYQDTGLHVTHGEVEKWLKSWGTKEEIPAPPCHR
jgi:predicted transcriptional regulator